MRFTYIQGHSYVVLNKRKFNAANSIPPSTVWPEMARKKVDATSTQQMSVIDIEKLVGVQSLFPKSKA